MGQHVPFDPKAEAFNNNFFQHFPIGNDPHPSRLPEGMYRMAAKGHWEVCNRVYIKEEWPQYYEADCQEYSELYLEQTPAVFYVVIDQIVRELGLSMDEVSRTINRLRHIQEGRGPDATKSMFDLSDYLQPIYIALRNKGYNKPELWG